MTPEERAKRALGLMGGGVGDPRDACNVAEVAAAIRAAVLEEREACAQVADNAQDVYSIGYSIAAAIRKRAKP